MFFVYAIQSEVNDRNPDLPATVSDKLISAFIVSALHLGMLISILIPCHNAGRWVAQTTGKTLRTFPVAVDLSHA